MQSASASAAPTTEEQSDPPSEAGSSSSRCSWVGSPPRLRASSCRRGTSSAGAACVDGCQGGNEETGDDRWVWCGSGTVHAGGAPGLPAAHLAVPPAHPSRARQRASWSAGTGCRTPPSSPAEVGGARHGAGWVGRHETRAGFSPAVHPPLALLQPSETAPSRLALVPLCSAPRPSPAAPYRTWPFFSCLVLLFLPNSCMAGGCRCAGEELSLFVAATTALRGWQHVKQPTDARCRAGRK